MEIDWGETAQEELRRQQSWKFEDGPGASCHIVRRGRGSVMNERALNLYKQVQFLFAITCDNIERRCERFAIQ